VWRNREIFTVRVQQAVFIETLQDLTFRQQEESKKCTDILKRVFGNPPIRKQRRGWIIICILY